MRADIHDGPEHILQSETEYIDARLHQPASTNPLAARGRTIHWVKVRKTQREHNESALPRTADLRADVAEVASGHVWTAPDWQGLSSRLQHWSEQPCVRPVCAVHMTAGHNALRGSGPGQNLAFDDAVALVGCPDRQIDRLCITCCLPLPTVTSRRMSDAISSHHFKRGGLPVTASLRH